MALAGLDVGTSGCKMVVFDLEGQTLCSAHRAYKELGSEGLRQIDPVEVMHSVKETIKEAASRSPEPIEAIAVASLGESVVCLDKLGKPLYRSMVTGDKRGIAEVKKLKDQFGAKYIMDITGLPPSEMYALPKLMWMSKHTDALKKAQYIFFYEDYITHMLTGKRIVSQSLASRSMAYDIKRKEWSQMLLDAAGICADKLSKPAASGTSIGSILPEVATDLCLPTSVVVSVGGHDQNCAAVGGGVLNPSCGEDGHGTCEVMLAMLKGIDETSYMLENELPRVPYVLEDSYLTFVEITTCGALMNWCRDTILSSVRDSCQRDKKDFFTYMDHQASDLPVTGMLVLPQFGSSGNPNVNYDAKGLIWGLTIHTSLAQIYRAVKEGLAFQMRLAYDSLAPLGVDLDQISLTGGGAESELTLQIRADVFGKQMVMLENKEAGALGCMIMAGVAINRYSSFEDGIKKAVKIKKVFYPDGENHKRYNIQYKKYKELYKRLRCQK